MAELFARRREQLRRIVYLRLDRRLQARADASDVQVCLRLVTRTELYRGVDDPDETRAGWTEVVWGETVQGRCHLLTVPACD